MTAYMQSSFEIKAVEDYIVEKELERRRLANG